MSRSLDVVKYAFPNPQQKHKIHKTKYADMAQLVEQLIRNEQVVGSSPTISSS